MKSSGQWVDRGADEVPTAGCATAVAEGCRLDFGDKISCSTAEWVLG